MSSTVYDTSISKDSKDVSFVKVYFDLTVGLQWNKLNHTTANVANLLGWSLLIITDSLHWWELWTCCYRAEGAGRKYNCKQKGGCLKHWYEFL